MIARLGWPLLGLLLVACSEPSKAPQPPPPSPDPPPSAPGAPSPQLGGAVTPPTELVMAVTPYMSTAEMHADLGPIIRHLGTTLGLPARLVVPDAYTGVMALIEAREAHLVVFSPLNYVRAKRAHPDLTPLVSPIAAGAADYASYIVAHRDSAIRSVEDLRGKRFGFVDRRSASGYLYAVAYLKERGHEPDTFFREVVFAGNHTRLGEMVIAGEVDGAATYAVPHEMKSRGRFRIIAKTGRIPLDVFCATPSLDATSRGRVLAALLELSTRTAEGRQVLTATTMSGFIRAADSVFDDVRRVERAAGEGPGGE